MAVPEVHYARSGDVAIAYAVRGEGPVDLIFVHGFAGNLDLELESPYLRPFHDRLASFSRLVMFDRRGTRPPTRSARAGSSSTTPLRRGRRRPTTRGGSRRRLRRGAAAVSRS